MAIRQAAGANALDTADAVKAKMAEMSRYFPQGMKVVYPYDTTPFVRVAIFEVVKTLLKPFSWFSSSCGCSWATSGPP